MREKVSHGFDKLQELFPGDGELIQKFVDLTARIAQLAIRLGVEPKVLEDGIIGMFWPAPDEDVDWSDEQT